MSEKTQYNQRVVASPGDLLGILAWLMYLLPKNLISWVVGAVSRIEFPHPFSLWCCQLFVKAFGIDMGEAERAIRSYVSIEDVFTRKLRDDVRPVVGPVCSPADGFLALSRKADNETAIQAKGIQYSLPELVLGEMAEPPIGKLNLAWFNTVYLAPHNYHRVHSPISGSLVSIRYLPGELWPVNGPFVKRIPRLFNRNERMVFEVAADGGGRVFIVMVGALNVGRISTPFWDFVSNSADRQLGARPAIKKFQTPEVLAIGDELGTFMLGSTVVVVYDEEFIAHTKVREAGGEIPVLMGQTMAGEND